MYIGLLFVYFTTGEELHMLNKAVPNRNTAGCHRPAQRSPVSKFEAAREWQHNNYLWKDIPAKS